MKLEAYAVHDAAVGAFNKPLFFRSRGEAIRAFEQAVREEANGFTAHPEHFSFYQVGVYDDADGVYSMLPDGHDRVCGALDFIVRPSA